MSNFIHPTAIIDQNAVLGNDNFVGPYCVVGPNVSVGNGNRFEAFVSIGTAAQHRDYFHLPPGAVQIGNMNVFREHVTVNGGTTGVTIVGDQCSFLIGAHVGHDAQIKNFCNFGNNTNLGGHVVVDTGANLGLSVVVHQHRIIGAYSMIGMNSTVTKNIVPFIISHGTPCEHRRLNRVGLQRSGVSSKDLVLFENWFEDQSNQYENLNSINHSYNKFIQQFAQNKTYSKGLKSA